MSRCSKILVLFCLAALATFKAEAQLTWCLKLIAAYDATEGGVITGTIGWVDASAGDFPESYGSSVNVELRVQGTGSHPITCSDVNATCVGNTYSTVTVTINSNQSTAPFSIPL